MLGKLQTNWKCPLSLKSQNHRIFWFGRDPQGSLSPNLKSVLTGECNLFSFGSHTWMTLVPFSCNLNFGLMKGMWELRVGRWVLVSEGKPQLLYIHVDNSDAVFEVISVKSQCLRVPFGKHLFQEGPHVNSGALHAAEPCLSDGLQRLAGGQWCLPTQPQAGVFVAVACFFPLVFSSPSLT